jgi:leucyl-tRNA synthetase
LRLYEDVLGPLEQAKPWNTAGFRVYLVSWKTMAFVLWRRYFGGHWWGANQRQQKPCTKPLRKSLMILRISLSILVSQFMICVNELSTQKCHSRDSRAFGDSDFAYAPHMLRNYGRYLVMKVRLHWFLFQFWS